MSWPPLHLHICTILISLFRKQKKLKHSMYKCKNLVVQQPKVTFSKPTRLLFVFTNEKKKKIDQNQTKKMHLWKTSQFPYNNKGKLKRVKVLKWLWVIGWCRYCCIVVCVGVFQTFWRPTSASWYTQLFIYPVILTLDQWSSQNIFQPDTWRVSR